MDGNEKKETNDISTFGEVNVCLTTGKNEKEYSSHATAIKIYRVEAVGLKSCEYVKFGAIS